MKDFAVAELEPGGQQGPLGLWSVIRDWIAAARRSNVSKGVAVSYANTAIGTLSTLILVPMYVRFLGAEEYGLWITVSGVVAYLGLVNLGLTQSTANRFGEAIAHRDDQQAEMVLNAGLWTYAKIVFIALVVTTVAGQLLPWAWLVRGDAHQALMARKLISVAAAAFLFELPLTIFGACLRSIGRIYTQQTVVIGQTVTRCTAAIIYLLLGGHVVGIILLLASINITTHFVLLYLLRGQVRHLRISPLLFKPDVARSMHNATGYFFVLQASGAFAFGLAPIVISSNLGPSMVANYGVAQRLVMIGSGFAATIAANFAPVFLKHAAREEHRELVVSFQRAFSLCMLIGLLAGLTLTILGPAFIIRWVGAPRYIGNTPFFCLVGWLFLQVVLNPFDTLLVATSRHRLYALAAAWEAVLNVSLSLILVRHWGIAGVIAAMLIGRAFGAGPVMVLKGLSILGLEARKVFGSASVRMCMPGVLTFILCMFKAGWFQQVAPLPWIAGKAALVVAIYGFLTTLTWKLLSMRSQKGAAHI